MPSSIITTVSATSQLYVTLAVVRDELGVPSGEDDRLNRLIASASARAITAMGGRRILAETLTETFRVPGYAAGDGPADMIEPLRELCYLSRLPIVSITSVVEDGITLVANTDYDFHPEEGWVRRLSSGYPAAWSFETLAITYVGGFATTPSDIEQAVLSLVTDAYRSRGRAPGLKEIEVPGVLREAYWVSDEGLPQAAQDVFDSYTVRA